MYNQAKVKLQKRLNSLNNNQVVNYGDKISQLKTAQILIQKNQQTVPWLLFILFTVSDAVQLSIKVFLFQRWCQHAFELHVTCPCSNIMHCSCSELVTGRCMRQHNLYLINTSTQTQIEFSVRSGWKYVRLLLKTKPTYYTFSSQFDSDSNCLE